MSNGGSWWLGLRVRNQYKYGDIGNRYTPDDFGPKEKFIVMVVRDRPENHVSQNRLSFGRTRNIVHVERIRDHHVLYCVWSAPFVVGHQWQSHATGTVPFLCGSLFITGPVSICVFMDIQCGHFVDDAGCLAWSQERVPGYKDQDDGRI